MRRTVFYLAILIAAVLFPVTLYLAFYKAPLADKLYLNQKIFYYHVPSAFNLFIGVVVCGVASLMYLRTRKARYDDVAQAAAELAVLFGVIVLVSGSIWARAAWGAWWLWEVRLTTSLLLWMVMLGYVLVRKYGGAGAERLAAGLAVFGMADIPLVYFSVKIWRSHHPGTGAVPGLSGMMRLSFWLSVFLFLCVFIAMIIVRSSDARSRRQLNEIRELGVDAELFE